MRPVSFDVGRSLRRALQVNASVGRTVVEKAIYGGPLPQGSIVIGAPTRVAVGLIVTVGAIVVLGLHYFTYPDELPALMQGRESAEGLGTYEWTFASNLLQFASIVWWSRRGKRPMGRLLEPSNSMWFIPVYVWGFESLFDTLNITAGDGWPNFHAISSWVALLITLGLCFGAEHFARARGCAARAPQGTLPLPVVAGILGVLGAFVIQLAIWGTYRR